MLVAHGFGASTGEISLNAPGDPRVGVTRASYGGALALLLAGYDDRVDALVPVITWNDLGQALFPNAQAAAGPTPVPASSAPDGVFEEQWAGRLHSAAAPSAAGSAGLCGRFP